jgi:hypothetical protein
MLETPKRVREFRVNQQDFHQNLQNKCTKFLLFSGNNQNRRTTVIPGWPIKLIGKLNSPLPIDD